MILSNIFSIMISVLLLPFLYMSLDIFWMILHPFLNVLFDLLRVLPIVVLSIFFALYTITSIIPVFFLMFQRVTGFTGTDYPYRPFLCL
jgi:hypothetical protein